MPSASVPFTKHRRYIRSRRLDQLFDDKDLTDKLILTKYRVLTAFDHATVWCNGRLRGADNYIVGVGPRQKDLVDHVVSKVIVGMNCTILTINDLPYDMDGSRAELRQVIDDAERQLLAACISTMVGDSRIWFEEQVPGTWNVLQSTMDEYRRDRPAIAAAKKADATWRRTKLHGGSRLRVVH